MNQIFLPEYPYSYKLFLPNFYQDSKSPDPKCPPVQQHKSVSLMLKFNPRSYQLQSHKSLDDKTRNRLPDPAAVNQSDAAACNKSSSFHSSEPSPLMHSPPACGLRRSNKNSKIAELNTELGHMFHGVGGEPKLTKSCYNSPCSQGVTISAETHLSELDRGFAISIGKEPRHCKSEAVKGLSRVKKSSKSKSMPSTVKNSHRFQRTHLCNSSEESIECEKAETKFEEDESHEKYYEINDNLNEQLEQYSRKKHNLTQPENTKSDPNPNEYCEVDFPVTKPPTHDSTAQQTPRIASVPTAEKRTSLPDNHYLRPNLRPSVPLRVSYPVMQACLEATQEATAKANLQNLTKVNNVVNFDRNLNFRRSKRFVRQSSSENINNINATDASFESQIILKRDQDAPSSIGIVPKSKPTVLANDESVSQVTENTSIILDTSKLDEILNESSTKNGQNEKKFNHYFKAPSPDETGIGVKKTDQYKFKKSCGKKTNKIDNVANNDLVTIGEFLKEIDSSQIENLKENELEKRPSSKASPRRALSNIFSEIIHSETSSIETTSLANSTMLSSSAIHFNKSVDGGQLETSESESLPSPKKSGKDDSMGSSMALSAKPSVASSKATNKSRKLGQILKFTTVRGAKSKLVKHKSTSQYQQYIFFHMKSNSSCSTCQGSSKGGFPCKNCLRDVNAIECKSSGVDRKYPKKQSIKLVSRSENSVYFNPTNEPRESSETNSTGKAASNKPQDATASGFGNKSSSEENQDYETIKSLRDSVDSLNYKLDEKSLNANSNEITSSLSSGCILLASSSLSLSTVSQNSIFDIYLADLNKEFLELDMEFNVNNWADLQTEEFLNTLSKLNRYKQENIFEFLKTEINYVKILNITQKIYIHGMLNDCKVDAKLINQMFPDLDKLIHLHKNMLNKLIERYKKSNEKYVNSIGDILNEIFTGEFNNMVEIYSKVCCMHVTAKSIYKQLSLTNKPFKNFLQECRKNSMLRRYQIPDCLTIITQRLTKYLTLIGNMLTNSKDEQNDSELLAQSLEKLRHILTKVNDAVAFYQNTNEFKKLLDNIDAKSSTNILYKVDKQIEQKKFTKNDLVENTERKILSLNQVTVKCMSKNGKVYKDVMCLTMNDIIVFLHLNDKSKYVFINDNSVIPCINGILIRPKVNEITPSRSSSSSNASQQSSSSNGQSNLSAKNASSNSISNSTSSSGSSSSSSSSNTLPAYIVNTITNEIVEIKFPDEISRNQWLTVVHTHITPFIEESSKDEHGNHLDAFISHNGSSYADSHSSDFLGNRGAGINLTHKISDCSLSSCNSSIGSFEFKKGVNSSNRSFTISSNLKANLKDKNASVNSAPQQHQQPPAPDAKAPINPVIRSNLSNGAKSNSSRPKSPNNSNSNNSSTSNLAYNHHMNLVTSQVSNALDALNLSDSGINTNNNSIVSIPIAAENTISGSCDVHLSSDLADILCSFNNLIEQSIFQGNIIRSASSAGETITRNNQDLHTCIPKRAETFNGASSKELQLSISINSDLLKSRACKNTVSTGCMSGLGEMVMGQEQEGNGRPYTDDLNSTLSVKDRPFPQPVTDSGRQSDHDHENNDHDLLCNSSADNFRPPHCHQPNPTKQLGTSECSNTSTSQPNCAKREAEIAGNNKSCCSSSTVISKPQFENLLKCLLNDYIRLKDENQNLRKELEVKNESITQLNSMLGQSTKPSNEKPKTEQPNFIKINERSQIFKKSYEQGSGLPKMDTQSAMYPSSDSAGHKVNDMEPNKAKSLIGEKDSMNCKSILFL